jgi:SPP1 gp7 family putative phage head morphogenesis protein
MSPVSTIEPRVQLAFVNAFNNLDVHLRSVLKEFDEKGGILQADQFNLLRLDNVLRNLRVDIDRLGYGPALLTELQGLEQLYREVRKETREYRKKTGKEYKPEFLKSSQTATKMLMEGAEIEILQQAEAIENEIGQLLRRAVLGGGTYKDLINDIQIQTGRARHRIQTLITTTLQAFSSQIRTSHAEAVGVTQYAYLGPNDAVTRPWCKFWVGKRATMADFEKSATGEWVTKLDRKDQPTPVKIWRGGWNCRHDFVPLFDEADMKKYPEVDI